MIEQIHRPFLVCMLILTIWLCRIAEGERHSWKRIHYPNLPCPWTDGEATPTLSVGKGVHLDLWGEEHADGLIFGLSTFVGDQSELRQTAVSVRMHLADGTIVEPRRGELDDDLTPGWRETAGLFRLFPWGENKLIEAWLELTYDDLVFWLEVPYGFTRDPNAELCPSVPSGRPQLCPAMMDLGKGHYIVGWQHVEYESRTIVHSWSMSLLQSNPFDASSEVVIDFIESEFNLHSAPTKVSIHAPDRSVRRGRGESIRRHERGFVRSDRFSFGRFPTTSDGREWGRIQVDIDGHQYDQIVPSSLYKYVHGTAARYHGSRLANVKRILEIPRKRDPVETP